MATVQFGTTTSPPDTLHKAYTLTATVNGTFKETPSEVRPVFITETDCRGYNYAYIGAFSRYYFIEDVVMVRQGLYEVHLKSDPMMSFQTGIRNAPIIAERSTNIYNGYITDDARIFKAYDWNQYLYIGEFYRSGSQTWLLTVG